MSRQPSDETLAAKLQQGDLHSLKILIARYQKPLIRYAGYLGVGEESDDVIQETFIRAYRNIRSYNPKLKWSSWLYRIAHNQAISYLRAKRYVLPLNEYFGNARVEQESIVEQAETKRQVKHCLGALPMYYREVLTLYYLEEKTYKELSDIFRLPIGTISARLHRAKKEMRKICQNN